MVEDLTVLPLHAASAVVGSVTGYFCGSFCDLVVATCEALELYRVTGAEPELIATRKVSGQLTTVHKLSPPSECK